MSHFITGFPGFIATRLVRKLAGIHPEENFKLLVHPSQIEKAENAVRELDRETESSNGRFEIILGDITKSDLGITNADIHLDTSQISHLFHLAAIYDLAVGEEIAEKVNVQGTLNVTNWAKGLPNLQRYLYFSTAYVSGRRKGTVLETELIDINGFKNFYESTKFKAEVIVQRNWDQIPTTIIRPGVVMGDSRTGETDKFDGPYFVMRFLDKFSRLPIPNLGRGEALFNVVPVNFVVDAVAYLSHYEGSIGKVYHLVDPVPHRAREAFEMICKAQLGTKPKYSIPLSLVGAALSIPSFRRWLGVEKETLEYFSIGPVYDSSQAQQDLAALRISCPDFATYIDTAVKYFLENKDSTDKLIKVT